MCISSSPRSMPRCATTNLPAVEASKQDNVEARLWQLSSERRPPTKGCPFILFPAQARHDTDKDGALSPVGPGSKYKVITVGVTAYNEEAREVHRTLRGLNECLTKDLRQRDFRLCVFLVFDGLEHLTDSCETLIASLVGARIPDPAASAREGARAHAIPHDACTFFAAASSRQARIDYPNLSISVLVKQDNRGKANSLEWYFQSFCSAYHPLYAATTDAGTYFKHRAFEVIDDTFTARPQIAALYNRVEIMSAADQGMKDTLFQSFLRDAATYQYEANGVQDDGYSMIGHIPTLPGYASVYKYSEICGQPLDNFFVVQNSGPSEVSGSGKGGGHQLLQALRALICENRKLTEDVNIALEANFSNNSGAGLTVQATGLDSGCVWDPEVTIEKLIQQRRRWSNGGYAGKLSYFWSDAWRMSGHSPFYVVFFCWGNIKHLLDISYRVLSPALEAAIVHKLSHDFFLEVAGATVESSTFLSRIVLIIYMVFFLAFCFYHAASKSVSTVLFVVPVFIKLTMSGFASAILVTRIRGEVSSVVTASSSAATGFGIFLEALPKVFEAWWYNPTHSLAGYCDTNGIGISNVFHHDGFGPFLLIMVQCIYCLRGLRSTNQVSTLRTLKHYLCYEYIYKQILGGWFYIFCIIRLDDLRWGNRPGSVSDVNVVNKQKRTWGVIVRFVSVIVIVVNLALTFSAVADVGREMFGSVQRFSTLVDLFCVLVCLVWTNLAATNVGNAFSNHFYGDYLPTRGLVHSLCDGISLDIGKSTTPTKKNN